MLRQTPKEIPVSTAYVPHAGEPIPQGILDDILAGKLPNFVDVIVRDAKGREKSRGRSVNLRTNAGADWQAAVMGSDTQPASAQWIGLTTNATAPAAGDTTLTGEIASGGLTRAEGAYTHTNGTTSYKISFTFTATAAHTNVAKAGLFNASSAGTMAFETLLSSTVTLAINDTLTIEWTVNI
jgi:hypothetical protein